MKPFKNKAHQSAYDAGAAARSKGRPRQSPYEASSRSSLYFRRAWLAGYDSHEAFVATGEASSK